MRSSVTGFVGDTLWVAVELESNSAFQRRFSRLAATNVVATLMVPLAGLIDVAFLGHLDDIRYLAGVALAAVLFDTIFWLFGFLRMGTTGMTAQAKGRGDQDEVFRLFLRAGSLAIGLGVAILLLQWPLREAGFWLLQGTEVVEAAGRDYWEARIWAAPFTLAGFVFLGWFLGQERGGLVLLLSAVANLTNVALDYYFIVVEGKGAWGAGMATALSQVTMCGVAFVITLKHVPRLWSLRHGVLARDKMRSLLLINRDLMLRTLALLLTFAAFTNLGSIMGTTVLAANAVLMKVQLLASYVVDGLAYATEAMAGVYFGQGRRSELKRLVVLASKWAVAVGTGVAIAFAVQPDVLYGLLTVHDEVLQRLRHDTLWLLPILSVGSVAFILDGYFIGLTRGGVLLRSMLIASGLGFAPLAVAAWYWSSPQLLWAAMTAWMFIRTLTLMREAPKTWSDSDL